MTPGRSRDVHFKEMKKEKLIGNAMWKKMKAERDRGVSDRLAACTWPRVCFLN